MPLILSSLAIMLLLPARTNSCCCRPAYACLSAHVSMPCSADAAKRVHSQLCAVVRPMYSSPPIHGAAIVVKVLSDPQLFGLWRQELAAMSGRIQDMRTALKKALIEVGAFEAWSSYPVCATSCGLWF
jgi:aspartate/tyrosine/aromatic aminotransferase